VYEKLYQKDSSNSHTAFNYLANHLLSLCIYQLFSKWHSYRIKKTRRCHSVGYSLKPFIGANLPSWKSQKDPKLEVGQLSKRQPIAIIEY
jgi:hypothetical protein